MPSDLPLSALVDDAQRCLDAISERLAHAHRQHRDAMAQQDRLQEYRHDYQQRLQNLAAQGLSGDQHRNYHRFLQNLHEGLSQQNLTVAAAEQRVSSVQAEWSAQHQRVQALRILIARHDQRQRHQAHRQEQRDNDSWSALAHRRRQDDRWNAAGDLA